MRLTLIVILLLLLGCDVGGQKQSKKGKQALKRLEEQWKKAVKEANEACAKADKSRVEDVLEAFEKCRAALDVLPFGKKRDEMEKQAEEWNRLLRKVVRRKYIELMSKAAPAVLRGDIRSAISIMKNYPSKLDAYNFPDIEDGLKRYRSVLEKQNEWTDAMRKMYQEAVQLAKQGNTELIFREASRWVKPANKMYNDGYRLMKAGKREAGMKMQQDALFHLTLVQILLIGAAETELARIRTKERKLEYLESLKNFGEGRQISGYITKRKKLLLGK
ncbi:MAG: hypothetical protein DRP82_05735 [Planctomycetota bacterium]|nr:MAG: hypothetical protein DRP82_05735 [Planctomycetota bacterium]